MMDCPNPIISMSDLSSHSSNHETDYLDEEYVDLDWQPPPPSQDQKNQINVDQKRSFEDDYVGSGGRRVTDDVIDDNEVENDEAGSGSHEEGTEPLGKCFYGHIFVVP